MIHCLLDIKQAVDQAAPTADRSLKSRSRWKPVISRSWRKALLTTRCHRDRPPPRRNEEGAKKPNLAISCEQPGSITAKILALTRCDFNFS